MACAWWLLALVSGAPVVAVDGTWERSTDDASLLQLDVGTQKGKEATGFQGKMVHNIAEMVVDPVVKQALSRETLEFLQLAAPNCHCGKVAWDQYALCNSTIGAAKQALSFGIHGSDPTGDPWAKHLANKHSMKPHLFDCYDLGKPKGFEYVFKDVCLGSEEDNGKDHRRWTTLPEELLGARPASVLVKMDIESSEWNVLGNLSKTHFSQLGSLHVEYHLPEARRHSHSSKLACPDLDHGDHLERLRRVLSWTGEHLAVVEGSAYFYGKQCLVGGKPFPHMLTVNYAPRTACL